MIGELSVQVKFMRENAKCATETRGAFLKYVRCSMRQALSGLPDAMCSTRLSMALSHRYVSASQSLRRSRSAGGL